MRSLTSLLYALARLSRDANAVSHGPEAMMKRQIRKTVYKGVAKGLRRL